MELIIERKERERRVGAGHFVWGVGNAPALTVSALARTEVPVKAVFSLMKSRPKPADTNPARTFVWRSFVDAFGKAHQLPPHVLVTSRGDSPTRTKSTHYALMCWSDQPLLLRRGKSFDPAIFRNASGNGAPVGPSQVTALLRRVEAGHGNGDYEENFTAWLTGSYWVRLLDPVELTPAKQKMLGKAALLEDKHWLEAVATARRGKAFPVPSKAQQGTLI